MTKEVESFTFNHVQRVPSGVRFGSAGGFGIIDLTEFGKLLLTAKTVPSYTTGIIGGVFGSPFNPEYDDILVRETPEVWKLVCQRASFVTSSPAIGQSVVENGSLLFFGSSAASLISEK